MIKKILFVIGSLDTGGAEKHLVTLLPRLREYDYEVSVYTLTHKGKLSSDLEKSDIKVVAPFFSNYTLNLSGIRRRVAMLLTVPTLLLLIFKEKPTIVHTFLPTAYLIGGICSVLLNVKIRIMSRRSLAVYQEGHPVLTKIELLLHKKMTKIIGNSKSVCEELLREGVSYDKLALIYNGVEHSKYVKKFSLSRNSIGLSDKVIVIIIVASLIPYKGHSDLLYGLADVKNRINKEFILLIVGRDSHYKLHLEQLVKKLDIEKNVKFMGERNDIPQLLKLSDIAILSSHQEGFSNSILEYMAAGLPMIVTNVGGNSEAVIDGQTGIVIDSKSPKKISKAIEELVNDKGKRKKLGENARLRLIDEFSFDRCVENYCKLYESVLEHY